MTLPPRRLRALWVSDAPYASSGYSVQTRLFAPRLAQHADLALLATYGLQGARMTWENIPLYPGGADPFANDVIAHAARDWRADVVITLKDSFVFNPEKLQGVRWCPMTPIDHDPTPPQVESVLRAAYRPIAYAPNGFRALRKSGFDPLYVPHAYDPAIYYPDDKAAARKALGIDPAWFVVGMVAVNRGGIPSRKAWPQNLEAFALFAKDKPNARLFLHTNICLDGFEAGVNLAMLCGQLGITDKVLYCDQQKYKEGFPDEYMRAFYNAMDVLNATSLGEGFGIPTLEAQACGTPVVVGDWCAQEDLCFGGWKVPKNGALKFYDNQGAYVYIPHPEAVAQALDYAYHDIGGAAASDALKGAQAFAVDRVVSVYWLPALAELERQMSRDHARGVLRIVRPQEVLA